MLLFLVIGLESIWGKSLRRLGCTCFFSTLTACAFLFYSPFCSVLKPPFLPCVIVYMGWVFGNTTESPIVFWLVLYTSIGWFFFCFGIKSTHRLACNNNLPNAKNPTIRAKNVNHKPFLYFSFGYMYGFTRPDLPASTFFFFLALKSGTLLSTQINK